MAPLRARPSATDLFPVLYSSHLAWKEICPWQSWRAGKAAISRTSTSATCTGRVGRTVTENDNIWFTLLTNNTNQIHFNNEYGKRTEFGKCLINSALTLAIVAGMGVADVSENGFALGWDQIRLPNPLFAGDTLYSESEVLEKRDSRSKPQWGIVKVRTRGVQQEGKVVIDYARSVMVWRKEFAPRRDIFPEIVDGE